MNSQMDNSILYQRPKQSEVMQGISDGIRAVNLEFQKLHKIYNWYDSSSTFESACNMLEQQLWNWDQKVQELRQKGL